MIQGKTLSQYMDSIVLASASPARRAILESQGLNVIVRPTDCNEDHGLALPGDVVTELASRKLDAYMKGPFFTAVLPAVACDTLIWFNGSFIGKPADRKGAEAQLKMLSGKTHEVYSGYALFIQNKVYRGFDRSEVTFENIGRQAIEQYLDSGQWMGAAGSYRIGGLADIFIKNVHGHASTVAGLPLETISDIIKALCR